MVSSPLMRSAYKRHGLLDLNLHPPSSYVIKTVLCTSLRHQTTFDHAKTTPRDLLR